MTQHEHEHCFHGSLWERNNLPSNSSFDSKVLYSNTWYGCWIFLENRIEKSRQALSDSKLQLFRSNVWLVLLYKDKKWIISHFVASQIKNWYLLSLSEIPSSFHLGFHDSVTIHHRPNFISMLGYQNQPNIYRKWRRNAEPIFLPLIWEGLMKDSILANVSCLVCGIRFVHMFRIKNIAFIMLTCSLMASGGNIEGNLCVIEHTNAYKQSCMKLCAILLSALSTSTIRNRPPTSRVCPLMFEPGHSSAIRAPINDLPMVGVCMQSLILYQPNGKHRPSTVCAASVHPNTYISD